jgi:ParB family transcriptional regulator, chromosome partitioning protein
MTYNKGTLYHLLLVDLLVDPDQPRKTMDAQGLEELATSITRHGILEPILFRQAENDGKLYIVAGERRVTAARQAGLTNIPALLVDGNDSEIALVENLLRQDLTAVEEAEALQRLKEERQYTDEQLSGVIGRARTTLSDILLISGLPSEIRDEARGDRKISKNTLIDIARKKQARAMITAWNKYKEKQTKSAEARTKQSKAPATAEEVIDWVARTNAKLSAIDTTAWADEEKSAFTQALETLQTTLGNFIHATPVP